ncbi:protein ADP-ribosyltransferase PARP3-like [Salvia splendens]|uniref:protein ADP-ribosyltransferase PARP3-like n=1 Tax=Salvia splendens TaxID=180675 RepID=UPI001C27A5D3|nr:protein ADP-ribosyltransferase PARP3-like [Salvia splendens]
MVISIPIHGTTHPIQARGTTRNSCHEAWNLHLSISESCQTAAHLLPNEEKHAVELVSEVHETRSDACSSDDQERVATRKHKAEAKASEGGSEHWAKRAKTETEERAKDVKKANTETDKRADDANKANTEAEERAEDVKKAKAKGMEQAEDVEMEESKNNKGEENENEKSTEEIIAEFENICKAMSEHLSLRQMREILEANGEVNDAVVPGCQDVLFCGTSDNCPACGGTLKMS